jgi:hypothetical protein
MEKTIMNKYCAVLIVASGLFTFAARAQVTNVTFTELETFEAQTGKVIVKGAGQIGSMTIDSITVTVICKESTDVGTGLKEYGAAVEISANNQRGVKMVVDYDEMDSLLNGINYLAQIDSNVTTLPTFVASYVTKSGLRVGAYTSQRRGAIQYFLQDRSFDSPRILMTSAQLAEFQNLMEQAKKNLDSLRAGG